MIICYAAYRADGLELDALNWAVVLGIVAEHSGTVEGAVILREIQPALQPVGAVTADTNTDDVRRAARAHTKRQLMTAKSCSKLLAHGTYLVQVPTPSAGNGVKRAACSVPTDTACRC